MPSTTKKIVDALIAAERAKMEAEAKAKEDADIAAIKAQHEASEAREKQAGATK